MSNNIVCVGDSIMYGANSANTLTMPLHVRISFKYPKLNIVNLAVSGYTAVDVYNTRTNADLYNPFRVIVWVGVNDIATGSSAATLESSLQSIYTYYKSTKGYEVWAMTITPRDDFDSSKNTIRDTVNTWIKNTATSVDRYIDSFDIIKDPSDSGIRYPPYADSTSVVHLQDAGYAAIMALFP